MIVGGCWDSAEADEQPKFTIISLGSPLAADDQFALNKLPKDKNAPFVMYCDGTICWKSYKSAVMAIEAGWKNVYWFRGGFPEWKEAGMPIIAKKE